MKQQFILLCHCPDQKGIINLISKAILETGGNILEFDQFTSQEKDFFCRAEFETDQRFPDIHSHCKKIETKVKGTIQLIDKKKKLNVGILVSKPSHCLIELVSQWSTQHLPINITSIISNHKTHQDYSTFHNIPYHHIPVSKTEKNENLILEICKSQTDILILARYMQVLSKEFIERYNKPIINVHHSLLPAFKGAAPYQKAYDMGVKHIGATSHFVTEHLDEGPIIEQDTVAITHQDTVDTIRNKSQYLEKKVLADTVHLYAKHRIIKNKHKTVVF